MDSDNVFCVDRDLWWIVTMCFFCVDRDLWWIMTMCFFCVDRLMVDSDNVFLC